MPSARSVAIALFSLALLPFVALAQYQPPSDQLTITADRANTWSDGETSVVAIDGPVTIQTDRAKLTADRAVVWLTPIPGTVLDQMSAEIALLGNATVEQNNASQTAASIYVTTQVRGSVRITAEHRIARNMSDSQLYQDAAALRPIAGIVPGVTPPENQIVEQHPWLEPATTEPSTTQPTTKPLIPLSKFHFAFGNADTITTPDGTVGALLWNGVTVVETRPNRDVIQMQAQRVVIFTPLTSIQELGQSQQIQQIEQVVAGAYLEGDVRITLSPFGAGKTEQQLRAKRVYYDFATDRAVLTDAVVHTVEPLKQIPIVLRAHMIRQLSVGEYTAEQSEISTSSFATPSYSIKSSRSYVRAYDTGDPRLGQRVIFSAHNNWFEAFHVPLFYWPLAAGSMTEKGGPLRQILFGSSRGFGQGIRTEWGFFESIGKPPPKDLDISYHLDYFENRGPAGGVDATYGGGVVSDTTKKPWNFTGDFQSYFAQDHGMDRLGRDRARIQPDDDTRYAIQWEHQHFFDEDWTLQLRVGLLSDPTFLEQWFQPQFNEGLPHDVSAYLKRQRQTEALTLLINFQPNDFVTTADSLQEQVEVEKLPELGYYRVGDSLADDQLTFFSSNTFTGLHFKQSDATLAEEGFRFGETPGLPSIGQTGITDDTVWRGDFRQEIDYPFNTGEFKIMPYVFGRYTGYSKSPDEGTENRIFTGAGMRVNTAFWKVDNTAESDLFDIHRLRHVVEPQVQVFTSASTVDHRDVFVYDEPVDAINDVSAVQFALNQRWQTKRGGAGQWRSVDFFTLNIEANFFANKPDDELLAPKGFRGLYFSSAPETSIPRNSINADSLWRISDATALLSDFQYNLDEMTLATTSVGLAVQRDTRLSYFLGARYIGEINSTIASVGLNYELSAKYSVRFSESVNLSERQNQDTSVTLVRNFDRFFMTFTMFYDAVNDDSGFRFGIFPQGLGFGLSTNQLQQAFGP